MVRTTRQKPGRLGFFKERRAELGARRGPGAAEQTRRGSFPARLPTGEARTVPGFGGCGCCPRGGGSDGMGHTNQPRDPDTQL